MVTRAALVVLLLSLSAQAVEASSFGRTPGNFSVSRTGSAQYSIPIWTPPGPRGIQPNLALVYNSNGGIGPLGIGWSLAGLGGITRCNLTSAQDAAPANVTLAVTDGYCLNGNRLRLTSGTYGTAGSTYQTEIADFSNVTANGTVGSGPASFTVQGRDGNTYLYGFTDSNGNGANSQVLASGTSTALTWLLSKVMDRAGNNLVINYTALTGTAVPNDILWTPTSAGASTYTYKLLFNYVTNAPQSSFFEYIAGTPVSNPKLLSSIELFNGTTVIKDYFLGYQASPLTGREELISFTECADSAETNCLLPTTVNYQGGSPGVSTTPTTAMNMSTGATRYDFNGDGIPDLITSNGSTLFVAFGSPAGYGTPFNTGIAVGTGPALFGNVTGGHEDGILKVVGSTWTYYLWNGSSFTATPIAGFTYDASSKNYMLADINGDGLPDLFSQKDTTTIVGGHSILSSVVSYHLNTSSSTASFSATLATAYSTGGGGILSVFLQGPDSQFGRIRRYDFNGDGRDDLIVQVESGTAPNLTLKTYELISTGTAFSAALISTIPASTTFIPIFFTNWNDDKCTDFVTSNTLYISGCNGSAPQTYSLPGTILVGLDWDGDGRTDILVQNGTTIGVYLSPGNSTVAPSITPTSVPWSSSCTYMWMDANGDGLDDLGCVSASSVSYYPHNGTSDLATSFVDGYGVTYSPVYMPLSASGGLYTKGTSAVFPNQDYSGPMYVVSSYASSDGIGGTFTTSYTYAGAILNLLGRGFQGFTSVSSTDSRTGFKDTRTYSTGMIVAGVEIPTVGMPLAESVTQSAGTNVSVGTYTLAWLTLDSTSNNQRYFPYTASSSVDTYEVQILGGTPGPYNGQKITTTAIAYGTPDIYGNFSSVEKTVTDQDPASPYTLQQWTTTTATTISASPSTWCNSLPTERDVTNTAPGVPSIVRHLTFVLPDYANCRQTEQVVENGNSTYQVDTKYTYDPAELGNLTGVMVTGIGMAARTTTLAWGPTGQFPTSVTNALLQTSHVNFDPNTGKTLSAQDPNGTTISWQYDAFGRKIKETRPDGTYTIFEYNDCVTWGGGGCVHGPHAMALAHYIYGSNGVSQSNGTNWLDQFDRLVIDGEMNVAGTYDRIDTRYDNLGNIAQQSMPCAYIAILTPCTQWTTFTHDLINRLTQSQRPINAGNSTLQTTTIQYTGRTTATTDPQSKVTTNITKVTGSVGRTKDNDGYYINFNHDAFGSVLSVTDSLSNTLRSMTPYAYGIAAFKTSMTDMDLGTRTYTHDALGELTSFIDSKAQSFSITYDALSRPLVRTDPDLTTTWVWGTSAASFNIGKLQSVMSTNAQDGTYSEAYGFDSAGRPTTTTFTIPNLPVTYTYTKTYNATTGLLDTLQYPVSTSSYSLKLQYGYSHLFLQSVSDFNAPTTVFWTANSINPRGQIAQETLGNGVVTTRSYDAVTGWLNNILAGVGSGSAIQNNAYLYDEMGNVIQRQGNNQILTEDFFYDNLYRLDHSTLGGATNLQMHYDVMGNITSRSDVAGGATWTYDPVHKHQVTQAGSSSFAYTYDANGNMNSRLSTHPITWTSTNYPITVGGPGESSTWTYGPNGKIYKSFQVGSFGDETTYHAGKLFELVTFGGNSSNYRHYIMAGNELVAIYSRTFLGVNTLNYVQSDHQGNIASITTSSPATDYVNENFTAFGDRRNGQTWSGAPTTADQTSIDAKSRMGYGGHTAIGDHMGLVHMGGRIEDAVLGRFLSADPRGTIPGNTQSWNRYAYVLNNPLTFIDPSGFGCVSNGDGSSKDCDSGNHPDLGDWNVIGCAGNCRGVGGDQNQTNGDLVVICKHNCYGSTPDAGNSPPTPPPSPEFAALNIPDYPLRPEEVTVTATIEPVTFDEVIVTAPISGPPSITPISFPRIAVQLSDIGLPGPLDFQSCISSRANNSKTGRNILTGMAGGTVVGGALYWVVAAANLEDGIGEGMIALRILQIARVGNGYVQVSEGLTVAAGGAGVIDAGAVGIGGAGTGLAAGAAFGTAVSRATCPN
jgi:RHS repeat-associated protein